MRITLRQLQIFLAVAEAGTTAAAADRLALSQSATSAALNDLEDMLRTRLFDRVGKRLLLNDSGRMLLPQSRQVLDAAATIECQFLDTDGINDVGSLHIGASTTIGAYLLPAILAAVSRGTGAHPRVTIANTADIALSVERFEVDMGMVEGPCHSPDLEVTPWIMDELVIVASPQHPILTGKSGKRVDLKSLRSAGWLLRESGSGTRETVEQTLLPHLHTLHPVGEFSNSEAIKHAAAEGLGLACMSRLIVSDLIAMGRLVQLQTSLPRLQRHFYLVHHRNKILSARLAHFLQFCRAWKPA